MRDRQLQQVIDRYVLDHARSPDDAEAIESALGAFIDALLDERAVAAAESARRAPRMRVTMPGPAAHNDMLVAVHAAVQATI